MPDRDEKFDDRTFSEFMRGVATQLGEGAEGKGYNSKGADGENHLFYVSGVEHACGELVYKAIRFRKTRKKEDMLKAAAWAFLAWKHHDVFPE